MSAKRTETPGTDVETKKEVKAETKTEAKVPVKSAKAKETKKEPMIYLGPDIKGIASHRDVFSDGVGSFFEKKIEEIPVLKNLLFPISEGGKKLAELKNGGAVERLYQVAKDQLEKGEANG